MNLFFRICVIPLLSVLFACSIYFVKVLADSVDIPCRLVKGQLYTGFDDVAANFVKIDDGR